MNNNKDLLLIETENHVIMINCNLSNKDFSLAKNIIQTEDSINQIKLMHKPNSTQEILTVVDNSGVIVVLTIDLISDINKRTNTNIIQKLILMIIHLGVLIVNILI